MDQAFPVLIIERSHLSEIVRQQLAIIVEHHRTHQLCKTQEVDRIREADKVAKLVVVQEVSTQTSSIFPSMAKAA